MSKNKVSYYNDSDRSRTDPWQDVSALLHTPGVYLHEATDAALHLLHKNIAEGRSLDRAGQVTLISMIKKLVMVKGSRHGT